jgi:hypothetical protein
MTELFTTIKEYGNQHITSQLENMYESGISCLDLIEFMDKQTIIELSENKKTDIMMSFYILKKEYRCEKLLMFHILQNMLFPN